MFTILVGIVGFFFVPSTPRDSQILTEHQKESTSIHILLPARIDLTIYRLIMRRLEKDRPSISSTVKFSLKEVVRSLGSPHVIMVSLMAFMVGTMSYGLDIFLPSIVSQLGFSRNSTQLLSVGPLAAGFIGKCF